MTKPSDQFAQKVSQAFYDWDVTGTTAEAVGQVLTLVVTVSEEFTALFMKKAKEYYGSPEYFHRWVDKVLARVTEEQFDLLARSLSNPAYRAAMKAFRAAVLADDPGSDFEVGQRIAAETIAELGMLPEVELN